MYESLREAGIPGEMTRWGGKILEGGSGKNLSDAVMQKGPPVLAGLTLMFDALLFWPSQN